MTVFAALSNGTNGYLDVFNLDTDVRAYRELTDGAVGPRVRINSEHIYAIVGSKVERFNINTVYKDKTFDLKDVEICDFIISPSNSKMYTCSKDKRIVSWDLRGEGPCHTYQHNSTPRSIQILPSVNCVVIGDNEGALNIWCNRTGKIVQTLELNMSPITSLSRTSDDSLVGVGSEDEVYAFRHHNRVVDIKHVFEAELDNNPLLGCMFFSRSLIFATGADSFIAAREIDKHKFQRWGGQVAHGADRMTSFQLCGDGSTLYIGLQNGSVTPWLIDWDRGHMVEDQRQRKFLNHGAVVSIDVS